MGINLIDKIVPKNDAFVGLVDANQVIGTSGGVLTSYLPSSVISSNSISEVYLKVSNTPSDGYYLQYKDSTDELTWTEVVGGSDVAWSGASEFYGFSSNAKDLYHPSGLVISGQQYSNSYTWYNTSASRLSETVASSNKYSTTYNWFTESGEKLSTISGSLSDRFKDYITSSTAFDKFTSSGNVNRNYIDNVSSNAVSAFNWTQTSGSILYYPSSIGVGTSGTVASLVLHSSNISIHIVPLSSSRYSDTYAWYSASASKLSESGSKYSEIYNWYNLSSTRFGELLTSGTQYTNAYNWVLGSSQRYENLLSSGTKYSKLYLSGNKYSSTYNWFIDSAQKLTDISGTIQSKFMLSSVALSKFADSANINERFVASSVALQIFAVT